MKPLQKILFAALALLLGTLVGAVLLELGVRAFGVAPPVQLKHNYVSDPFLPWKPLPGSTLTGKSRHGEFDFNYEHNSLGFRDVERGWDPAEGVFRIVGIGDSFTYGWGVDFEETYLAVLEQRLNAGGGSPTEVIKLGVPRYWLEPYRIMLEHYGLRYQPNLVLVGILPNDFYDAEIGLDGLTVSEGYLVTRRAEQLGKRVQWLYTHSFAARAILSHFLKAPEPAVEEAEDAEDSEDSDEATWELMHAEQRKMIELARGAGAEIAFIHIPQKPPWRRRSKIMPTRLRRFCEKEDCLFIDVQAEMLKHPEPASLYYPKDGHCNEAGYAIVAEVIYREIVGAGLVPGLGSS